jgi:hypothetical protein
LLDSGEGFKDLIVPAQWNYGIYTLMLSGVRSGPHHLKTS